MEEDKNNMFSLNDKEIVKEFIERKREESDKEAKKLEAETKEAINDLKQMVSRAGRNIKVEVTDEYTPSFNFKNCLCCNQPALRSEIHDICDNCNWQDDPVSWNDIDYENNANGISLRQARINFERTGNCDGIAEEPIKPNCSED